MVDFIVQKKKEEGKKPTGLRNGRLSCASPPRLSTFLVKPPLTRQPKRVSMDNIRADEVEGTRTREPEEDIPVAAITTDTAPVLHHETGISCIVPRRKAAKLAAARASREEAFAGEDNEEEEMLPPPSKVAKRKERAASTSKTIHRPMHDVLKLVPPDMLRVSDRDIIHELEDHVFFSSANQACWKQLAKFLKTYPKTALNLKLLKTDGLYGPQFAVIRVLDSADDPRVLDMQVDDPPAATVNAASTPPDANAGTKVRNKRKAPIPVNPNTALIETLANQSPPFLFECIASNIGLPSLVWAWGLYNTPFDVIASYPNMKFDAACHVDSGPIARSGVLPLIDYPLDVVNDMFRLEVVEGCVSLCANISLIGRMLSHVERFDQLPFHDYLLEALMRDNDTHLSFYHLPPVDDTAIRPNGYDAFASSNEADAIKRRLQDTMRDSFKLPLFPYQVQALTWMMGVETRAFDHVSRSTYNVKLGTGRGWHKTLIYDVGSKNVLLNGQPPQNIKWTSKGGLLADEMGLGKTVQIMALLLANPPSIEQYPKIDTASAETHFIESRATLVIAPSQLVTTVWKDTFTRCVNQPLSVLTITSKPQFAKISVREMMAADLVIVSFDFFVGDHHIHMRDRYLSSAAREVATTSATNNAAFWKSAATNLKRLPRTDIEKLKDLPLFFYNWHRLVIDEAHDLKKIQHDIANVHAENTWCLSGTPFVTTKMVGFLASLIGMKGERYFNYDSDHTDQVVCEAVRQAFTWRSTKKSVKEEVAIPPMVESVHVLEFSLTERRLYDAACAAARGLQYRSKNDATSEMRALCCQVNAHVQDEDGKSMDEIEHILVNERKTLLHSLEAQLAAAKEELTSKEQELDRVIGARVNDHIVDWTLKQVSSAEAAVKELEDKLATTSQEIVYFESIMNIRKHIRFDDEVTHSNVLYGHECPFCLDDVLTRPALTICGHVYCVGCIEKCKSCPICRAPIDTAASILPINMNVDNLVTSYGTKMGNLVRHLKKVWSDDPNDRIIVFASRQADLARLKTIFDEMAFKSVYCRGHAASRSKAIRDFNDAKNDVRIMLLSVADSAAGTNLVIASEIILFDSVWEPNDAKLLANELQALNRAHRIGQDKRVRISRFLIRNTVETDRYKEVRPEFDPSLSLSTYELAL